MIQSSDEHIVKEFDNFRPLTPRFLIDELGYVYAQRWNDPDMGRYPLYSKDGIILKEYNAKENDAIVKGYDYCYMMSFALPVTPDKTIDNSGKYEQAIYTYGQLIAMIEAKKQMDSLCVYIREQVKRITDEADKSKVYIIRPKETN